MSSSGEPIVHRLGNGLTVLIQENHSHPVVSLQYWVGTGSADEGYLQGSGISHLLEHLVFKGTQNYSGQDLAQKVQERGGHWNAYTSLNRTVYYIDGPSDSWKPFLTLLSELVFVPTFPEDEIEREKDVVRREMAMYADDPDAVAYQLLMQTLYKKHPRRWPVLGLPESFDMLTRKHVLEYHGLRYVPNNIILSIAGDIPGKEVLEALDHLVGSFQPKNIDKIPALPERPQYGSRTARQTFAIPYSKLMLSWRIPSSAHPDTPALSALAGILGGGRSARLYEKYHDRLGLVHSIDVGLSQYPNEEGNFTVSVDVDRERRDEVRDMLIQEFRELCTEEFDDDLKRIRKQSRMRQIKKKGTAAGMASDMASNWFATCNLNLSEEWMDALDRVTSEDMKQACEQWLCSSVITEVSLDPEGEEDMEVSDQDIESSVIVTEHVLSNGLKIVIREDHRLPIVWCNLVFQAGCPSETEQTAGVSDLMSECLLKGTKTRSASDIARYLEDLGGSIDTEAGNNSLSVGIQVLSEDVAAGLELLGDVVTNPIFPEESFEREKETFIADAEESLEVPLSLAFREERRIAFGSQSYGHSAEGTPESLSSLRREDVVAQYERIVCATNGVLCLSGDINALEILPLLEKNLGQLKHGSVPTFEAVPAYHSGEKTFSLDKQQAVLVLGVPSISVDSSDMACALVFNSWCCDMAGPLFTKIREEEGLAYYVASSVFAGIGIGSFCFYLGTSPERLQEADERLNQVLQVMETQGMSVEELERTKATALSARLLASQSGASLCRMLALDVLFGLSVDYFEKVTQEIREMSRERINNFIRKILGVSQARSKAIVRPPLN